MQTEFIFKTDQNFMLDSWKSGIPLKTKRSLKEYCKKFGTDAEETETLSDLTEQI